MNKKFHEGAMPLEPMCLASFCANAMEITSTAFTNNGQIPAIYTCEGKDLSPPLNWNNLPENTKSVALIVDDPDAPDPKAPKMTWVHWVLYNLPPTVNSLPEAAGNSSATKGALEGKNDWGKLGYGGPCPPIGEHRYFFKLYALDVVLPDLKLPTKAKLEEAMRDHVIAKTELMGRYQKAGK